MTPSRTDPTRRAVLMGGAALAAGAALLPGSARALSTREAEGLIDKLVADFNRIINSGMSQSRMIAAFEKDLFAKYADVALIAQLVLGPPARSASRAEMRDFTRAFQGYMARKYGTRFREFVGGRIEVQSAGPWKSYFQVKTVTRLAGSAPFEVTYRVSERSGKPLFIDMLIEGISLVKTEAIEVRALHERQGRNLKKLTAALKGLS
ncbi:MlaC/ttg2D family ABC transporter substrate-binding protein [Candidatus Rhodobacter oscarellae]|nr:ABC transporter substrate-binding protein [Candidatus Rhodobacter lobularis]